MTTAEPNTKEEREKDRPILCRSLRYYFREYCKCSSIHGFRYFGEKRTYFERIWWFIVFNIVVAVCAYQIREVYRKWERSPVIVSFATSETPIYSIPFPAVTICPESKSRLSQYNHTDINGKLQAYFTRKNKLANDSRTGLNETEILHASYMSNICENSLIRWIDGQDTCANDFFDFLNTSRRITFIYICTWMGKYERCDDLFMPVITDEGICQTFNMLDRADIFRENVEHYGRFHQSSDKKDLTWNLDDGYPKNEKLNSYPRRAMFSGVKNALRVTLETLEKDLDYVCKDGLQGYKVILHTPTTIPRPSNQYFRVPLNQVVLGSIHPKMITTSDTVKVFNPKRRKCYFPSERRLKYIKVYTQLNCQLECLTNFTLSMCKCVSFYMPREKDTKICGTAKRFCMDFAEKWLQTKRLVTKLDELAESANETDHFDDMQVPGCDCMPLCTDLSYDVETSQSEWEWRKNWRAQWNTSSLPKYMHMSRLTLYFKNSQFVTSKRHELYGPTDFLANFGGLLGLFTGFSILSVMEIIYFLTVRLCCNFRLYGAWYGPEQN